MENKGIEIRKPGATGLALQLSQTEMDVCNAINTFNQLRAFKLDAIEVLEWKDTIIRVRPDIDLQALQIAIDGMITGEIAYDQAQGIKNIFNALKKVIIDEDGNYKILKPIY
jgi:hypothetical protein